MGGASVGCGDGAADFAGVGADCELWLAAGAGVPCWRPAADLAADLAVRPDADADAEEDADGDAEPGFPLAAGLCPVLAPCCPAEEVAVPLEKPVSL